MKLDDYLRLKGLTGPKFAMQIGVDPATVYRIRSGKVLPRRQTIKAIWNATGGQVTVQDLMAAIDEETKRHHPATQGDGEINL